MRTRFAREANAFRSSCERVSHAEHTRFSRPLRGEGLTRKRILVTQSERILVLAQMRFTRGSTVGTYMRLHLIRTLCLTGIYCTTRTESGTQRIYSSANCLHMPLAYIQPFVVIGYGANVNAYPAYTILFSLVV